MDASCPSTIIQRSFKDLVPPEPLEGLVATAKFRIVFSSSTKCNEVHIMAVEVMQDEQFRLNEEMLDIEEDPELQLGRVPALKEIVLAPNPKENHYRRAIVVKLEKKESKAQVYFFDIGGLSLVSFDKLKPVNEEIMKFPILGYHVLLEDVHKESKLMLRVSFERLMDKLQNRDFSVKLGAKCLAAGAFLEKNSVILSYKKGRKIDLLAERIQKLKIWEWEESSKGKGTDDEICENGVYGLKHRRYSGDSPISSFFVKVDDEFTGQVSRVTAEIDTDSDPPAMLRVILTDDPVYLNWFNVLHCQMQRYSALISASSFYPSINEFVMFKLEDKPVYKQFGVKCLGRWCRGVRLENSVIYLIDLDDYIGFGNIPTADYQLRRLYGEFIKIPVLVLSIFPTENGRCMSVSEARQIFHPNKRYSFKITKDRNGSYEAECAPVVAAED